MDKIIYEKNKIILKNEDYFNIPSTLDCGQAFRWNGDGMSMKGVVGGKALEVKRDGEDVVVSGCDKEFFERTLQNYFDLDFDYVGLIKQYSHDEKIVGGAEFAYGLRMLNQEKFETLISFIISANNNVKRIKGIIERISSAYGTEIADGVYAFPTPYELRDVSREDYERLGAGYRGSYLQDTVKAINDGYDLEAIGKMDFVSARKEIQKLKGVGPKVADCVLLYAFGFRSAFPVDVWIKRVMEQLYFDGKETDKKTIEKYSCDHFGENAGIIQLFLFNYARKFSLTN